MLDSTQIMRQTMQAGLYDALQGGVYSVQKPVAPQVERGEAMGYKVEVMANPLQELEDSMEELSFQFEEKAMKTMGDRKLGEKSRLGTRMLEAIQRWQQIMPDLPGGAFLERLLNQLRQLVRGGRANPGEVLKQLAEGSEDPSHQFAMLDALEQALSSGETELKALLAKAKEQLQAQRGPEVRAGLNIADEVNQRAQDFAQMQDLRDMYRGEVLGFKNPQDCFRSLLAARGPAKLGESIDFLLKSCGVDLNSPSPSQSAEELSRILGDLQCVNVLTAVMDKYNALSMHLMRAFGQPPAMSAQQMTEQTLEFTETPFVNSTHIQKFVDGCMPGILLGQVYFCTDLASIIRSLSSRLFQDESARMSLVDAVQDHLDELVVRQTEVDQLELEEEEKKRQREEEDEA